MNRPAKKVLISESNDALNAFLVDQITSVLHLEVESVSSMHMARQILANPANNFFIAIIDLDCPDIPNTEIIDLVLQAEIPPIVLTENIYNSLLDEIMEKDIVDYFIKSNPHEIEYVVQTVFRILNNHNRNVLVVDDSEDSRKVISALLRRHKLSVLEAEDGESALNILERQDDISLMITDSNLPKMDGMELITNVRKKYSRTEMAIIGISASGCGTISTQLLKSGANDFIARPFMYEEFYCRVNQNLDAIISYQMLKDTADRDFLTGLFNRSYLFKAGENLFQNAKRKNLSVSVAMIDIDHFKKINDTYGHDTGDKALKHIADIFNTQLRQSDIICRIGGEEFCLLCINLNPIDSTKLFTRFLHAVSQSPLIIDQNTINLTISIGYTTALHNSLEEMIKVADTALYQAKNNGRNQAIPYII